MTKQYRRETIVYDVTREALAWAVELPDGRLSLRVMAGSRADAERAAWVGDRIVRVAIRRIEDEPGHVKETPKSEHDAKAPVTFRRSVNCDDAPVTFSYEKPA